MNKEELKCQTDGERYAFLLTDKQLIRAIYLKHEYFQYTSSTQML